MRVNPTGLSLRGPGRCFAAGYPLYGGGGETIPREIAFPASWSWAAVIAEARVAHCLAFGGGGDARVRTFDGAGVETVRLRDPPCDPTDETSYTSGRTSGRRP